MRTTVEIDDELREELIKLSAERGEKGYSSLINEALREFLQNKRERQKNIDKVKELKGCLSDKEAKELEERIEQFWHGGES